MWELGMVNLSGTCRQYLNKKYQKGKILHKGSLSAKDRSVPASQGDIHVEELPTQVTDPGSGFVHCALLLGVESS